MNNLSAKLKNQNLNDIRNKTTRFNHNLTSQLYFSLNFRVNSSLDAIGIV